MIDTAKIFSYEVFVINLYDSTDRLSAIKKQFARASLAFQRLSAVDMRGKSPFDYDGYDGNGALRYMGRQLSGGEIGCYLSHLRAVEKFLNSTATFGIVLEDDMTFSENLKAELDSILNLLSQKDIDWDLVNIGPNKMKLYSIVGELPAINSAHNLCHAHYFPMMTGGLVWSRRGAQAFLSDHRTIRMPVDNYMRHWLTCTNSGYAVWPPILVPSGVVSEIDSQQQKSRKKLTRSPLYILRKQRRLFGDKLLAIKNKILKNNRHSFKTR